MKKYIIREVDPESCDFSYYFDDDGLSEAGGDFCYTLFIVPTRHNSGFHAKEYNDIVRSALEMAEMFDDIANNGYYSSFYASFKECMLDNGFSYNSKKCHELKALLANFDENDPEDIAAFLTLKTGKKWSVDSARGYCQGDYCQLVFCEEHYREGVRHYGEVWLGAAKEFAVIEVDENGEEIDSCYGYIVADCQAWKDEDYKRLVCEWSGVSVDEAQLEMIDGWTTRTVYSYRTA